MIELSNVKVALDAVLPGNEGMLQKAAAKACGVKLAQVKRVQVLKRSVDARKKQDVHFVVTLGVDLANEAEEQRVLAAGAKVRGVNAKAHVAYQPLDIPDCSDMDAYPVVVGTGPAGLFAALYLARAGLKPLVLERGAAVPERVEAIARFDAGQDLDPLTNIQFGEGGAGTFSDGKLTTNIKNPLTKHVLRWLVEAGAPDEIEVLAKPHVGTDLLRGVVVSLRQQIEEAGGDVRFLHQLTDVRTRDGAVCAVEVLDHAAGTREWIPATQVILACGHSARDTFVCMHEAGADMEQKPFSIGVRVEHSQKMINESQYGAAAGHPALGAADYKLSVHLPSGRGVYTFCMCPGGEVVCATSETGAVVVNGMSHHARAGENANSAVLVGVDPADFGGDHPLAGVELQRRVERAAFETAMAAGATPYQAPAQTVGSFLGTGANGGSPSKASSAGAVKPTYARGVAWCDLHDCLPGFVSQSLEEALPLLDRKLHGFATPGAVMTGVETRSSSPVRIVRDADCQSNIRGLYPCGEGAGYAGGIMSAAADGLRCAIALTSELLA